MSTSAEFLHPTPFTKTPCEQVFTAESANGARF